MTQHADKRKKRNINYSASIETLESRTLLSESATAQLSLVSTSGTDTSPIYNYDITVTNTGTTNLGTYWLGWAPGENFLPDNPTNLGGPSGWGRSTGSTSSTPVITHTVSDAGDGYGIQWAALGANLLSPGHSLSGFTFSSPDSPSKLASTSSIYANEPIMTSFVYVGAPFSDAGFEFTVSGIAASSGLQPSLAGATLPASIPLNSKLKLTVPVSIANSSTSAIKEKTTTKLFLSVDGAFDGTQIPLATTAKTLIINGNSTAAVDMKITKLPAAATTGSYYLIASTTDASNTTLSMMSSAQIELADPTINFTTQFTSLNLTGALTAGSATKAKAVLSITNNGNIPSKGATTITLYASSDQTVASGTPITNHKMSLTINPTATKTVTIPLKKIPASLVTGTYFVIAQITDPENHDTIAISNTNLIVS